MGVTDKVKLTDMQKRSKLLICAKLDFLKEVIVERQMMRYQRI